MEFLLIAILGMAIGVSSALLGLGGNILIVPLLPLFIDIPLKETIATGIFTVFFLTLFNCYFFLKSKLIDLKVGLKLILPTFIFSFIGAKYTNYFSESFITYSLVIIMVLMIIRLNTKLNFSSLESDSSKESFVLVLSGMISGFLAGLTGVGNGVILGPILLGFKLVDDKKVSPTINFMIMIACLSATFNNLDFSNISLERSGLVRIDVALYILFPALISSFFGRRMNTNISKKMRRLLVSVTLIGLSLKLLLL